MGGTVCSYIDLVGSAASRTPGVLSRELANILDVEREAQGLSQALLADLAGLSQTQVSSYLRAEKAMTVEEAHRMCAALGLPFAETLGEADPKTPTAA